MLHLKKEFGRSVQSCPICSRNVNLAVSLGAPVVWVAERSCTSPLSYRDMLCVVRTTLWYRSQFCALMMKRYALVLTCSLCASLWHFFGCVLMYIRSKGTTISYSPPVLHEALQSSKCRNQHELQVPIWGRWGLLASEGDPQGHFLVPPPLGWVPDPNTATIGHIDGYTESVGCA